MSLRPRYSLLTLLVLTALVAGGVWFWQPHHVVERTSPTVEEEYTFTRNWIGYKNIHGVKITRSDLEAGTKQQIDFDYFRHGENIHRHNFTLVDVTTKKFYVGYLIHLFEAAKLSNQERREILQAVQDESDRLRRQGYTSSKADAEFVPFPPQLDPVK